jgi:uridine phosphorylase
MRFDAASQGYARPGYPAVPDHALTIAAVNAARASGLAVRRAVVADVDAPEDIRLGNPPRPASRAAAVDGAIRETGAVKVEGSPAVLFVQGSIHGLRTAFLAATDDPPTQRRAEAIAVASLLALATAPQAPR